MVAEATGKPAIAPATAAVTAVQASPQAAPEELDAVTRWRPYTLEASRRFGVPLAWIERVMRAESGGRTHLGGRPVTSRAGAMGLMQVMPSTWAELRPRLGLGNDPHDPRDNILAGTFYLRLMYDRFGYPGLFGAYNAGPARYAEWLAGRRALPDETLAYIAAVGAADDRTGPARAPAAPLEPPRLFAIRRDSPHAMIADGAPGSSLFVVLSTPLAASAARD
ncbi:MAG: lytic transglycosylase domain-containing protein [Sphingomonas sp.]|nr:lytic transglycosylase domain-containing protein [Sphingomonas sp.]